MRSAINFLGTTDIADRVSSVLAVRLHVHGDRITEAATFEGDLGATSLDMVAVIMSLEDEFRIEISDSDSEGLRTVGDVLVLIRNKLH
jgi:acyl carrier protein